MVRIANKILLNVFILFFYPQDSEQDGNRAFKSGRHFCVNFTTLFPTPCFTALYNELFKKTMGTFNPLGLAKLYFINPRFHWEQLKIEANSDFFIGALK